MVYNEKIIEYEEGFHLKTPEILAREARAASIPLAALDAKTRDGALLAMAEALTCQCEEIFEANREDVARAKEEGLAAPLLARLRFDEKKLSGVVEGLRSLASLPDPLGATQMATELSPGLELYRVACPIGVIGVIFESRPDALVQISALCLKSGNAALLKGGREALRTNRALFGALYGAAVRAGVPEGALALLETREDVGALLSLDESIDLIIPRGSNAFVRYIKDHSRIPVMGHADGLCHVYVDAAADVQMAVDIAVDSKAQSVAVCNACETLLVHRDVAGAFLPRLAPAMAAAGVRLRGCARTQALIACEATTEEDWRAEYLDYELSVRVVDSLDEAIAHVNTYGSGHTDCIVTGDEAAARRFMALVDSAGVYQNCSTRFADGFRYGFGAEVGIATGKVHARGPMGLEGLCIYKYKLIGSGQTVRPFAGGEAAFTHRPLLKDCPY